jgi:serine/threonine protein kinase
MHDSGIYHRDLHPGNFLVQTTSSGEQRMYLLDLHRASVRPSLGIRQRIRSLAQFNMFARISLSRSERLLFFDAYFGEDRPWRDDKRPLLDAIESLARTMSWRLWKRREQRCLSGNKYFMCLSFARMKGFARREEWKSEMAELLLGGDMVTIGARRVKESRSKALWEKEMVIRGVPRTLLIKQYKRKRGWKSIAYLTRPSQAIRSWRGSHALQIRNVGTVKAIAAIEERSPFHFLGNAYLISEKIPNVVNLAAVVSTLVDHTPAADAEKDALLRGLALFLRRIHALGIVHGDMKATNILVGARKNGGHAFYLTDLDFVRTRLRLSRRQVIRNLMQLNKSLTDLSRVSLRDRLRFLRAYCGAQTRDEIRGLRQTVARRTARSLKKSGRQFYHSQ